MDLLNADQLIMGTIAGLGSLAYNLYWLAKAKQKAEDQGLVVKWDWLRTAVSIAPGVAMGFLAGIKIDPSAASIPVLLLAGVGAADLGDTVGTDDVVKRYFRK